MENNNQPLQKNNYLYDHIQKLTRRALILSAIILCQFTAHAMSPLTDDTEVISDDDIVTTVATSEQSLTQLTNLPTLYINTDLGTDPQDTENYLTCTITWVEGETTTTYVIRSQGKGIRGRGNSTWQQSKKPWRIKFNNKQKFLGTGYAKAKSWTLLANALDQSLMRNALTYHLGQKVGLDFCPAAKFVDLVMNGTYRGCYQISDQVEVNEHRVQVKDEQGKNISGQNNVTWLLEYGNSKEKVDEPLFDVKHNNEVVGYIQIKNPDQDEIINDYGETTYVIDENITSYVNDTWMTKLSTKLSKATFCHPLTGYRSVNDEESLINWYVATEITGNWDAFYSIYLYRYPGSEEIPGGKMHWGPLWDEDTAYGNSFGNETNDRTYFPNGDFDKKLLADNNVAESYKTTSPNFYRKFQPIIKHLWEDPWFATAVQNKFNSLVDDDITTFLTDKIDEMKTELSTSASKNFVKWPISSSYSYQGRTWDKQVTYLKNYISNRIQNISTQIASKNKNNRYFSETTTSAFQSETNVNVVIDRPWQEGTYTTVCLPIDLTQQQISEMMGNGTQVYSFDRVTTTDGITTLHFIPVNNIEAGKPYLVHPGADQPVAFTFLTVNTQPTTTVEHDGFSFIGTTEPFLMPYTQGFSWESNYATCPQEASTIPALSAYIQTPENVRLANVRIDIDGTETFVTNLSPTATVGDLTHLVERLKEGTIKQQTVNELMERIMKGKQE